MKTSIHIHLIKQPDPVFKDLFESLIDSNIHPSYGPDIPQAETVQYLITGKLTKEMLENCTDLKGIIIPFVGIPEPYREKLCAYPHLTVHNIHHNALSVTENTLALLLAAAKHLIPSDQAMRSHDWRPRYRANPSVLLNRKTVLILGYGHIGKLLARTLASFEMQILATRNSIDSMEKDAHAHIYPTKNYQSLLPKAQFLINTLPLTPATQGLIGEFEFSLLPKGAVVVNIGRGKVIDQDAFYHALKSRHVGAAGIDVWYNYPTDEASRANTPPADLPFDELDNVVMSPHRAGGVNSTETEQLRMQHLAGLVNHASRGEVLPDQVDLNEGY